MVLSKTRKRLIPERYRAMRHALLLVLGVDLLLAGAKGFYGNLSGSLGMLSDGFHSAIHAAGSAISLIGVRLAAKPPDERHPYGYERYEPLATLGVAALMLLAVWKILSSAWTRLGRSEAPVVTRVSFAIMASAVLVSFSLAIWERRRGESLSSSVLKADADRVWGDTLVSVSVIAGLGAVRFGLPWLDAVVSVAVAAAIAWRAWGIIRRASMTLTDAAVANTAEIVRAVKGVEGVQGFHQIRTRGVGGMVRVDLHILVNPKMTVEESHHLTKEVERRVRDRVSGVTEVIVHVGLAALHKPEED
ncbi:MAG: cation diffusion facilitator family transporter [Deltaproteobacteria bacterium]|jgi:cation diffusion facilitator family transporter